MGTRAPLDSYQVIGQVPTSEIQTQDRMRQLEPLVDRYSMRDPIPGVEYDAHSASRGIERENGLDRYIKGRRVEGLKHNLSHFFPVHFGVQRGLGEQDWVFLRRHAELVVERVVPDLFHVVPVS